MTLEELQRLSEQATPGPWYAVPISEEVGGDNEQAEVWVDTGLTVATMGAAYYHPGERLKNAAYIAAACNMVPAMIDALRLAEYSLTRLEKSTGFETEALAAIRQLNEVK